MLSSTSSNTDKSYSLLKKLLEDAEYEIAGIVSDTAKNRTALMDALKLVRLTEAKERSGEAISYLTSILYSESRKEHFSKSLESIDLIGDVLANDFRMYEKVLKIINNEPLE